MRTTKNRPNKELAARIARELFTSGMASIVADHLQLWKDGRYLGGWGQKPCSETIERLLDEAAFAAKEKR